MTRWACTACRAQWAPGAPCCPQCRSREHVEEGEMPKISRDGRVTYEADAKAAAGADDLYMIHSGDIAGADGLEVLKAAADSGAVPEPEAQQEPAPVPPPAAPPRTPPRRTPPAASGA